MTKALLTTFVVYFSFIVLSQNESRHIQTTFENSDQIITAPLNRQFIWAESFNVLNLNHDAMNSELNGSDIPHRNDVNPQAHVTISLPNPDGGSDTYRVFRNTTMHPDLQQAFPQIRTYDVVGVTNRLLRGKIDITPHGFHAMIFDKTNGTFFIDPVQQENTELYMVYYKKHFVTNKTTSCSHDHEVHSIAADIISNGDIIEQLSYASCQLRTYRLTLAATGEYSVYHGGTVALAQAAQVTTMNRVNGIYEAEIAVTMEIVPNNHLLIFLDGNSDPYGGSDSDHLGQNITTCNNLIGNANYDIGHVFLAGSNSGVAYKGVICNNTWKGGGVTGNVNPIGDPFDVDYVAHEMGHQFGADHTQNNNCNRVNASAFEPGSASTILGYAGICSPNVQNNSDAYFHSRSLFQMGEHITGTGGLCAAITNTGNNAPTISSTNGGVTIPVSTPFALTATASDPDGDQIFYRWEQMDNQVTTQPPLHTATGGPNFRSFQGTTSPTRYFPSLNLVATNTNYTSAAYNWQRLPSVSRTMNFRVTAHDDHVVGGCSDYVNTTVTFDASSGPFLVTYPNATGITWQALSTQTVTWDVANTTNAAVNCQFVNIYLSTNSGLAFPTLVAANVPNNGSASITVPNMPNTTSRIMVQAANGTFFDMSNNNFTISAPANGYQLVATNSPIEVCAGNNAQFNFDVNQLGSYNSPVNLSVTGLPAGASASWTTNPVTPPGTTSLNISTTGVASGVYPLTVNATSAVGPQSVSISLTVNNAPTAAVSLSSPSNNALDVSLPANFSWSASPVSGVSYQIDIATNSSFTSIVETQNNLSGTSYSAVNLAPGTQYFWRVRALNACGNGPYSSTFTFTTSNCLTFASTNVPISISPVGTPTITSTINITQSGTITNLDVLNLVGTHTWMADLTFTLVSPQNTSVVLFGGLCGSNDNFNINMSDAGLPGPIPCNPTGNGGTYQPTGTLANFNGEDMQGLWTLIVADGAGGDGGALQSWSLGICYVTGYEVIAQNDVASVCSGNDAFYNFDVNAIGSYDQPVNFSISGLPSGASASWTTNPVIPDGSTTLQIQTTGVANGSYNLDVLATSSSGNQNLNLVLNVEATVPGAVTILSPANNAAGLSVSPDLTWSAVSNAASYQIDVSTTSDFTNIIESQSGIMSTSYSLSGLNGGETYYWRVRGNNGCGNGAFSSVFSFSTINCVTYASSNVPVTIPSNAIATVTSTINIAQSGTINNVDVLNLIGTHTWMEDLYFTLISPEGTSVFLFGGICGSQDNFNLNFSDAASPGAIPCPPTTGLTYNPVGSLADFIGEEMQGVWTLSIFDDFAQDGGQLQSWSLGICFTPDPCPTPSVSATGIDLAGTPFCLGGDLTLSTVGGSLAPGAEWEWFSGSCGGTAIGTGNSITVSPTTNTDYFVRASEGTGCPESACATVNFQVPAIGNSLSIDGDDATCVVNSGAWVHFYNANGRLIASVNSNGQDLGEVNASSFVNSEPYVLGACDDPTNNSFLNAVLARSFIITPDVQPTNPVSVRLYISEAEFQAYQTAAQNTTGNPFDNVNTIADMHLTKHSGAQQQGLPSDICAGGASQFIMQNGSGNTSTIFASIGSSYYLEYVIDGFSQFFPMNANNSALPVALTSFEALCKPFNIELHWTTASELNAAHFRVESSRDGLTWLLLGEIAAGGNSSQTLHYQFVDSKINNTTLYYRLVQVDLDGSETSYPPVQISCEENHNSFEVFPNPNLGSFHVALQSTQHFGKQKITISDLSGKAVHDLDIHLESGSYLIPFEHLKLAQGVYILQIQGLEDQFKPVRIVIGG